MLSLSVILYVFFSAFFVVEGTLTPDGTVSLDCGSQQTFTCSVTGAAALWTIRLDGISVTSASNGQSVASTNARITTNDTSGLTPSSTITITGFIEADSEGTIQCINQADGSVQGMASISVEPPSCPASFSANRDGDFTSANITFQLATPPPVTFTTVTYYPTLSPNSTNSTDCTSPCTISGLDPCVDYNVSAIPNNNCGNATGCTSVVVSAKGVPPCPSSVVAVAHDNNDAITVTWQQLPNTPPVTTTTVTYCPTSSPNCGNSTNCTSPCTISGLDPGTVYQITVISDNNCGNDTGCSENSATVSTVPSPVPPPAPYLLLLLLLLLLLIPCMYPLGVLIVQRCCYKDKSYCEVFWCCWCCGCCAKGQSGRNSKEPMKTTSADDYADPKKVREKKEEKIQYAALEFSEQAGSSGEKPIRSKEEPVQYLSVEQA